MKTAPRLLAGIMLVLSPHMLSAESNTIVVDSEPRGASVYWQGKRLGVTPLTITPRTPDAPGFFRPDHPSCTLYVYKEFHQTASPVIAYRPGSDNRSLIVLKRLPRLPLYNGIFARRSRFQISTLVNADLEALARMREEVYARYGRPIKDKRFTSYFARTRWYTSSRTRSIFLPTWPPSDWTCGAGSCAAGAKGPPVSGAASFPPPSGWGAT